MDKITEEFYGFRAEILEKSSKTIKEGMEDVFNNNMYVVAVTPSKTTLNFSPGARC